MDKSDYGKAGPTRRRPPLKKDSTVNGRRIETGENEPVIARTGARIWRPRTGQRGTAIRRALWLPLCPWPPKPRRFGRLRAHTLPFQSFIPFAELSFVSGGRGGRAELSRSPAFSNHANLVPGAINLQSKKSLNHSLGLTCMVIWQ